MAERRGSWLLPAMAASSLAAISWWLTRLPQVSAPAPRPAPDYAGALARIAALHEAETLPHKPVNPRCRTALLSHGKRTPTAVALFHGFTNCPAQYERLGRALFERGHNVFVPRLAHHGLEDRRSPDFARLTADDMVALTAESCDILHGLGERTVVVGFSLGGCMAAWAAMARPDLDHAGIVSPAITINGIKPLPGRLAARLFSQLPNRFISWQNAEEERAAGPNHAYPHYATHSIAQMLRLGALVRADARRRIYSCGGVTIVTNPSDEMVDNSGIAAIVREWRRQGAPVNTYEFPRAWGLIHDIMDPMQREQQIERVYPQLLAWLPV